MCTVERRRRRRKGNTRQKELKASFKVEEQKVQGGGRAKNGRRKKAKEKW